MKAIRAALCAWVGHSRLATCFFGYIYCGRCHAMIGDQIAGATRRDVMFIGASKCNRQPCVKCLVIESRLNWRDRLLTPSSGVRS